MDEERREDDVAPEIREPVEAAQDDLDDLERRAESVEEEIGDVRDDWERKRRDESIPGAQPPEEDQEEQGSAPADGEEEGSPPDEEEPEPQADSPRE